MATSFLFLLPFINTFSFFFLWKGGGKKNKKKRKRKEFGPYAYGHFTFNAGLYPKWIWEYYGPFYNESMGARNTETYLSASMWDTLLVGGLKPGTCYHGGKNKRARSEGLWDPFKGS